MKTYDDALKEIREVYKPRTCYMTDAEYDAYRAAADGREAEYIRHVARDATATVRTINEALPYVQHIEIREDLRTLGWIAERMLEETLERLPGVLEAAKANSEG